ncbi:flavin monoamine oxidase family protein [Mycolicibacterium arenosum]|nr:FAD-dependent oxidoreductase [Mycolicibacterium sp. CAU 1645]
MVHVVVVGAGLSGLTAARDLHRAGVDVVVLEAADRVGGRSMSETSALGSRLDLGGQWLGPDHHRVAAMAAELGLTTYPMHTGSIPAVLDGARRAKGTTMLVAALALVGVAVLARVGTPKRWNRVTVDQWLRRVPGRRARRLLEVVALTSWTGDLDRMSVHAMTEMIGRQGGLVNILSTKGGAQETLLVEGAGTLAERIAAELGDRVRTGRRVTAIVRTDAGVTVRTDAGDVRAEKAIVAVPPPVAARIDHDPPLPAARSALERNTYMGSVYKAIAVYERPFWRGRSGGECVVLDGPGSVVFDSTAPGGPGHLCVLIGGPAARSLDPLDAAARRQAVLGPLVAHFGADVLGPVSWHEKAWHRDEFVGGGYLALPEAGTTDGFCPMSSTPTGDVHWAGAETADHHPGYLDGAVEAGERAAREVIAALSLRPTP